MIGVFQYLTGPRIGFGEINAENQVGAFQTCASDGCLYLYISKVLAAFTIAYSAIIIFGLIYCLVPIRNGLEVMMLHSTGWRASHS